MSLTPASKVLSNGFNFTETLHHDTYPAIDPRQADLSDLTVVITGATKGIGRATAISFAQAGASRLVLTGRNPKEDLKDEIEAAAKKAGNILPEVLLVSLDVTDAASVEAAAYAVKDRFRYIDILINNAGYMAPEKAIAQSDPFAWAQTIDVNVKGPYLVCRSFIPLLRASPHEHKTVVGVSSIGAHALVPGMSPYQLSKLSLLRLMEFVNVEEQRNGILAYSIHPGGVATDLASAGPDWLKRHLVDTEQLPADTTVWLTKERRGWLSGRYVSAEWDMPELESKRHEIERGDLLKVRMAVQLGQ